ncbi:hypothetical protein GHT06_017648 [Daphnia sinensis]|uniref:Glycerophosphodiester phosphodiesterase n=1 Tax=Daphnia sinensis TaxID=1820382 RepID=A0AAD5PRK9_9CRUS|nr:hypothetical protein GHT06_017648 [Daphnia sinensis]
MLTGLFTSMPWLFLHYASHYLVEASRPITVIAHMVNTPNSIRWALDEGANGIEIDLKFEGNNPSQFHHGFPCDCSCFLHLFTNEDNGCAVLGEGCSASTSVTEMTDFLGSSEIVSSPLALIYIDAKLDNSVPNYAEAGANVVRLFNDKVLARGFRGQILLGCLTISRADYLRGALREASNSKYADRYFYTIDNEGIKAKRVLRSSLQLKTSNIVYDTGITACFHILPAAYDNAIQYSLDMGMYAAVGVWTVDRESTMTHYLEAGVDFILTNRPNVAANLVNQDYIIASPGQAMKPKSLPKPNSYI